MDSAITATYTAKKISPMLAVADMEECLAFYHDVLRFTAMTKSPEYSIIERDGQTSTSSRPLPKQSCAASADIPRSTWKFPTSAPSGSTRRLKDRYKIRDLFDTDYGMTECHIDDPNGCLIFVGEPSHTRKWGDRVEADLSPATRGRPS